MTIGEQIKDLRIKNGVSQEQLAEAVNVSRLTVFRWENGVTAPKFDQMEKISEYFGLNLQNFLSDGESDGEFSDCENLSLVVSEIVVSSDGEEAESENAGKTKKRRTLRNIIISLFVLSFVAGVVVGFMLYSQRLPKELEGHTILYHASYHVVDWPGLIVFFSSVVLCILAICLTVYYVKKYKKEKIKKEKKHETKN